MYKFKGVTIGDFDITRRHCAVTRRIPVSKDEAEGHDRLLEVGYTFEEDVETGSEEPTFDEQYQQALVMRVAEYRSRSDDMFMEYQYDLMTGVDEGVVEEKRLAWLAEVAAIKNEFTLPEIEFLREEGML
jgi:hypothetical protein